MSQEELIAKLPKCHLCKQLIGEGVRTKEPIGKRLYLCDDCHGLFRALIHDVVGSVFGDIASILASTDETWIEHLETYSYSHSQP